MDLRMESKEAATRAAERISFYSAHLLLLLGPHRAGRHWILNDVAGEAFRQSLGCEGALRKLVC
jgi:hypothetical protein